MNNDLKYMKQAYKQALKAQLNDDVPVGAILVKDDKVIARAFNKRELLQKSTAHAELLVMDKACKKLKTWRLEGCTLYVTMEPCIMCSGAIIQSRIDRVVYGAPDTRWTSLNELSKKECNFNHMPLIEGGILEEECVLLIKNYFKNKR